MGSSYGSGTTKMPVV